MDRLRELVEEKPDRTLAELREELGVETSLMSVWRALQRLNLTLKKSPACI
jgi:transposase